MVTEDTEGGGNVPLLPEEVDTDTLSREGSGAVKLTDALDLFVIRPGHFTGQLLAVLRAQWVFGEVRDPSVDAAFCRKSGYEVNIGSAAGGRERHQF